MPTNRQIKIKHPSLYTNYTVRQTRPCRHTDKRLVYSMADSLQSQLLARVATFQRIFPSISKADIARHCKIDEANFSAALNGRRGLSADGVLRLTSYLQNHAFPRPAEQHALSQ
jgi:hypothetical protein